MKAHMRLLIMYIHVYTRQITNYFHKILSPKKAYLIILSFSLTKVYSYIINSLLEKQYYSCVIIIDKCTINNYGGSFDA